MKRRIFILIIAVAMVLAYSIPALNSGAEVYAATSKTADEAISWVKSKLGKSIDMDGSPKEQPNQCVDLIMAYYEALGVTRASGDGCDYATNTLPSGWSRVKGGTPKKGDILVYSANNSNRYGHVAIYESDYVTYHQNYAESFSNNGSSYVIKYTNAKYNNMSNPYWGYIRPNWKTNQNTFTVKFNANGGKGTMANITVVYGVGADISKCSFTKDYYKFAGWNVYVHSSKKWVYTNGSKDGAYEKGKQPSGYYLKVYKSKVVAPVSVVDKDTVELFAIWEPGKTFTVKFNANGGTGTMANINVIYGVGADVSNCNFKKDYYKFAGWNAYVYSSKKWVYTNGSQSVQAEKGKQPAGYYLKVYKTKVTYVSDVNKDTVELFAVWEPEKTFTVRFNANGGDGTMANKTVVYGVGADVSKCNFTRAAYTFAGWNAYVHSSKKWVYTNGSQSIQAEEGKQPEGYDLKVYKTRVTYVSDVDKDIVELYAVWEFTDPITPHPPYVKGETGYTSQGTFVVTSDTANTVAFTKAKNKSSVTVPDTVTLDDEKTYKVTQINAKAFTGSKIRTVTIGKNVKTIKKNAFYKSKATKLIVKTKYLTKKSVKGCLKGSKVKTVQIKIGSKKTNKAYVKKYKKIFTKANAGKKVTVK